MRSILRDAPKADPPMVSSYYFHNHLQFSGEHLYSSSVNNNTHILKFSFTNVECVDLVPVFLQSVLAIVHVKFLHQDTNKRAARKNVRVEK